MDCLKELGWSEQELHVRLSQYLDGELTGAYAEDLEEHLKECRACRELLSELRGADHRVARSLEAAKAPDGFVKRVMTALSGRRSGVHSPGTGVSRRLIYIIAGLGIFGVVVLVAVLIGTGAGVQRHIPMPIGMSLYAPTPGTCWQAQPPGSRRWRALGEERDVRTGTTIRLEPAGASGRILRPDGLVVHVAPGSQLAVATDATASFGLTLLSGRVYVVAPPTSDRITFAAGASCTVALTAGRRTLYADVAGDRTTVAVLAGSASLSGPWGVRELADGDLASTVAGGPLKVTRRFDVRQLELAFVPVRLRVSPWPQLGGSYSRANYTPFKLRAPAATPLRLAGAATPSAPAIGLDGSVFVMAGPKPGRIIRVLPGGATVDVRLAAPHIGDPVVTEGGVVLVALRTGVYRLDPEGGAEQLRPVIACVPPATPTFPLTLGPKNRFYVTYNRGLSSHALSGKEHWRRADIVAGAPPAVGPDGTVYVATIDGRLVALDPETGDPLASDATPVDEAMLTHPVVAPDGTAYVLSATRYLVWRAPDSSHGRVSLPEASYTLSPAIGPDGYVHVVSSEGMAYRLPPRPRASPTSSFYEAGRAVTRGPVVDRNGRMALWTATGKLLLVSKEGRRVPQDLDARNASHAAVARDGTLVFTTGDGRLYGAPSSSSGP